MATLTSDAFNFESSLCTPEIDKMSYGIELDFPTSDIFDGLMYEDTINLNTLVSPNTVCYGIDSSMETCSQVQFLQPQTNSMLSGFNFNDNGYSSSSSFPASPESMNLNKVELRTFSNYTFPDTCAPSPADSHFSSDSGASFYNLDQQPIKSEPQESQYPIVIDELNQGQNQASQPMMQQPMQYNQHYTSQSQQYQQVAIDSQYTYSESNYLPVTVTNMPQHSQPTQEVYQQQSQQITSQIQPIPASMPVISQGTVPSSVGRKRAANGAFASTSGESSSIAGAKKQRMTKRQKQQMMDKQVEDYTQKNKELNQQIELLQRKVQFCTQFLQKYVSPIVQGRTWHNDIVEDIE